MMTRIIAALLTIIIPLILTAQEGIQWSNEPSWQMVKEKAKLENKFIFIDCYATWCGPCKAMEKNVYPMPEVGRFMNDNFISIKVQMDRTEYDNEEVKKWYADAKMIDSIFSVKVLPTFIYFSPEGIPLHKAVGYRNIREFIKESENALDTQKQYYRLSSNYRPGELDTSDLKSLAISFESFDKALAGKLAADYFMRVGQTDWSKSGNIRFLLKFSENPNIQETVFEYLKTFNKNDFLKPDNILLIEQFSNVAKIRELVFTYLSALELGEVKDNLTLLSIFKKTEQARAIAERYISTLRHTDIYNKRNIEFIGEFINTSQDKAFKIFYDFSGKIDSVIGIHGFARNYVDRIIIKEEISPYLESIKDKKDKPNWKGLVCNIRRKYSEEYAKRNLAGCQSRFYEYRAKKRNLNWKEYIQSTIKFAQEKLKDTTSNQLRDVGLNNFLYNVVFLHSNDKRQIVKAIKCMEIILVRNNYKYSSQIDTYANLLYKAGRKDQAIRWEEKAYKTAENEKDVFNMNAFLGIVSKMKKGEPTWINGE